MTFNPNIPQSTDKPSQSQAQILTNFQQLNYVFSYDHVTFDAAASADRGKHYQVTYTQVGAPPSALSSNLIMFNQEVNSDSELFFVKDALSTVVQLTNGLPSVGSSGSTFLPGLAGSPLTLNWGSFTSSTPGSVSVTFNKAFSTSCYGVLLTQNSTATVNQYAVTSHSNSGFVAVVNPAFSTNYFYIAIGS